jgi:ParB family chromosome partitioning protein
MISSSTTIALSKLLAWDGNVRKTAPDKSIDELAASIAAHGLLQSLIVRKDKRGKYAVVAGRRRLLALHSLAEDKSVDADMPVPCQILDDDTDATEISLAENVQREPMHPADEFDAFKGLIDSGMPVADVAARFGVTETVVQKRLKLARVSPKLIASYRKGDMTLQHIMAFTVTDDHEAQERVWRELPEWQTDDPSVIRDMLTEHEITASDRRVKFVTLKAYEKAGGTVRRDLFSDDEDGVFIDDIALLEALVAKKLEKAANLVRKEGWKWVEIRSTFDSEEWSECGRRFPELVPLSGDEQAEMDSLVAEADVLSEIEEPDSDQDARLEAINDRLDTLNSRESVWTPETMAIAGAVVTLGTDGKAAVHCGFVRPEDAPPRKRNAKSVTLADGTVIAPPRDIHPATLIESLTAHRSAGLSAALLEHPTVALAAVVHVMALQIFYNGHSDDTALQITAKPVSFRRVEGSPAAALVDAAREHWSERIPGDPDELFAWCLAQDADTLRGLLAFCVAQAVNGVRLKADHPDDERMTHAALLAATLKLDMTAWFTPTASNYFVSISKPAIIDVLREIKGAAAPAWSGMKKTELAALAEREVAGTGWLPALLRAPIRAQAKTPQSAD